ncbi:heterokaryon incompatibility protein-domain-containing protein [Cadophora sp. MPI-SDFR-AT-0126]|nr:heterokaryon incompatibility protein-domain-containing protein [Leotiomycetes sp. MPI-SDFR-AT-0126]
MGSKNSKNRASNEAIGRNIPPENVVVIPEGSSVSDALFILLSQPRGYNLMVWLANKIIVSRDIQEWMKDFKDVAKRDVELAQMIRAFMDLMIQMTNDSNDNDRYSAILSAIQRRIGVGMYKSLDQPKNEIRLLKIYPMEIQPASTKHTGLLSCSLEVRSLDDESLKFDALSYVWGDAMQTMPIFIDNKVFLVTWNLYAALVSFRDNKKIPDLLWVDAICINQQDSLERNHQVALMAKLYRQAEKVHIWMGPETKHTATLFDKLEDCGGDVLRPGWSIMNAIHLADVESGSIHGLLDFLARPWWSRLWVIQEAELAQNPRIHCGRHEFDFRRLAEVLVTLSTMISSELDKGSPALRAVSQSNLGQIQRLFFLLDYSRTNENINPTKLLDNTTHCQSTVPHDRLYALLGLLPTALEIVPRYNDSIELVFEEAAFKILKWAGSLDLLRITALADHRKLGLPSWVPEFGNTIDSMDFYVISASFKADLGATCLVSQDRPKELRIRALVFDHILGFTKPLNHGLPDPTPFDDIRETLRSCRESAKYMLPFGRMDDLDFFQTISTSRLLNPGAGTSRWGEDKRFIGIEAEWTSFLLDDQYVLDEMPKKLLRNSVWTTHSHSKLFITTGGRIGLADVAPIEKGDVIAVLAGSNDPAVLRPVPERGAGVFKFVQNCYCHGVMDGEAVVEAFEKKNGLDSEVGRKMSEAVVANRSLHTRYKFRDAQPKDFQVKVRVAIDPLFEDVLLV